MVLAGGTALNAVDSSEPVEMIDLQAVGLRQIRADGALVEIEALVRLDELAAHEAVPDLLRELAHREEPSTLRNVATVGGILASASPDSELLAGFLVYQGQVTLARSGGITQTVGLDELFDDRSMLEGSIITKLRVETGGAAAAERTGRTPSDTSIVAAVGRRPTEGDLSLALTGVAATPILLAPAQLSTLDPPGDFRGSSTYRRHLAETLSARVIEQLGGQS